MTSNMMPNSDAFAKNAVLAALTQLAAAQNGLGAQHIVEA